MSYKLHHYNAHHYDFVGIVQKLFDIHGLQNLHKIAGERYPELFEVGKDSSTIFHKLFYDKLRADWPEIVSAYEDFIKFIVAPKYDEDFFYQKFPTFRVHLPGNIAVGAFHNDGDFHHPAGEVNFIIPLTNSRDTASCWVESEPGKKDFIPMEMNIGEVIEFNGNILTHGNKVNETGKTRVSLDFRILPISKYSENESAQSITTGTKFKEGDYYSRFTH